MVKAKKHLGQHFLMDESISQKIADSINIPVKKIIEVGPGTGMLTQFLINQAAEIEAYEIDSESVQYLNKIYSQPHLKIIEEDFLKADLQKSNPNEFIVVGNFPYNISTQIIFKVLENYTQVPQVVGMFQKEVAERICANEGNKTYGITSVLTQLYYDAEYLFTVDENAFNPAPKVKSGVIRLTRKTDIPQVNHRKFQLLVKTAFNQRRKKLGNALKSLPIPENLKGHNFLNLRAEQLSVQDFVELWSLLYE